MAKNNWSRNELIVAFNLYCKTPFTKINSSNKAIKELAKIIGRSDSAVALKLANYARLDPALQVRNISGMSHGSKGEEEIWNEFTDSWEVLSFESERILSEYTGIPLESQTELFTNDFPAEGKDREVLVRLRVNQNFFRKSVLASYDNRCCVTGISIPELLVAGHIIPWAVSIKQRMNPANGLCLNAIHDKAFDKGLITITPDFILKLSEKLFNHLRKNSAETFFLPYDGKKVTQPQKFHPLREFLEYHNYEIFKRG